MYSRDELFSSKNAKILYLKKQTSKSCCEVIVMLSSVYRKIKVKWLNVWVSNEDCKYSRSHYTFQHPVASLNHTIFSSLHAHTKITVLSFALNYNTINTRQVHPWKQLRKETWFRVLLLFCKWKQNLICLLIAARKWVSLSEY